jgi:glutaredoxin
MTRVTVYTRRNCPLCDEAIEALDATGVVYKKIDIASDPGLEAEYGAAVPVVEVDGVAVFEGGMDPLNLVRMRL